MLGGGSWRLVISRDPNIGPYFREVLNNLLTNDTSDISVREGQGPKPRRRVIIEAVHPGHPTATERKRG